jgi:hypothetical protein
MCGGSIRNRGKYEEHKPLIFFVVHLSGGGLEYLYPRVIEGTKKGTRCLEV